MSTQPTSFQNKKELRFIITLEQNGATFDSASSANQITLEGFRATCDVDKAGGFQMNTMRAQIYGVSQSHMNTLTSLQWQPDTIKKNQIEVYAIDGQQETLIFVGNIGNCWANYAGMPEVFLEIQAFAAFINQVTPVSPTSVPGPTVDVGTMMGQLAQSMGYTFENNLLQPITLPKLYLAGTLWSQAQTLATNAKIDVYLDDNILAITTSGNPRNVQGTQVPQISAASGMVGYPTFGADNRGPSIVVQTLFNPSIRYGSQVQVVTSIQPAITNALTSLPPAQRANGFWIVNSLSHHLQSETPGGAWFSRLSCGKQKVITSV
jgi:hypothetical protein